MNPKTLPERLAQFGCYCYSLKGEHTFTDWYLSTNNPYKYFAWKETKRKKPRFFDLFNYDKVSYPLSNIEIHGFWWN